MKATEKPRINGLNAVKEQLVICSQCHGHGYTYEHSSNGHYTTTVEITCKKCHGARVVTQLIFEIPLDE